MAKADFWHITSWGYMRIILLNNRVHPRYAFRVVNSSEIVIVQNLEDSRASPGRDPATGDYIGIQVGGANGTRLVGWKILTPAPAGTQVKFQREDGGLFNGELGQDSDHSRSSVSIRMPDGSVELVPIEVVQVAE